MLSYKIYLYLPNCGYIEIANFTSDLGLREGDQVYIKELKWDKIYESKVWLEVLESINENFLAIVTKRSCIIKSSNHEYSESYAQIDINLEIADKELISKLEDIITYNSNNR